MRAVTENAIGRLSVAVETAQSRAINDERSVYHRISTLAHCQKLYFIRTVAQPASKKKVQRAKKQNNSNENVHNIQHNHRHNRDNTLPKT